MLRGSSPSASSLRTSSRAANASVGGPHRPDDAIVADLAAERHLEAIVVLFDPRDAAAAELALTGRPAALLDHVRPIDVVKAPALNAAILVKRQVRRHRLVAVVVLRRLANVFAGERHLDLRDER